MTEHPEFILKLASSLDDEADIVLPKVIVVEDPDPFLNVLLITTALIAPFLILLVIAIVVSKLSTCIEKSPHLPVTVINTHEVNLRARDAELWFDPDGVYREDPFEDMEYEEQSCIGGVFSPQKSMEVDVTQTNEGIWEEKIVRPKLGSKDKKESKERETGKSRRGKRTNSKTNLSAHSRESGRSGRVKSVTRKEASPLNKKMQIQRQKTIRRLSRPSLRSTCNEMTATSRSSSHRKKQRNKKKNE